MPRRLLIVLLSVGTVFGYASGCVSLARCVHRHHGHHAAHRQQLENRVADVCLRAAERAAGHQGYAAASPAEAAVDKRRVSSDCGACRENDKQEGTGTSPPE